LNIYIYKRKNDIPNGVHSPPRPQFPESLPHMTQAVPSQNKLHLPLIKRVRVNKVFDQYHFQEKSMKIPSKDPGISDRPNSNMSD
jgi:hypothetical protein